MSTHRYCFLKFSLVVSTLFLITACGSGSDSGSQPIQPPSPPPAPPTPQPVIIGTDFNLGEQGWVAGFSDYPVADTEIYELEAGIEILPDGSGEQGFGIQGFNRSDDLFMFLKTEVTTLDPNQRYTLHGSITFLSNAGVGCVGIGGPPGEAVFVKLGATEVEPAQADYFLNVDKGNQSMSGNDAIVIGDVASTDADCSGARFGEKTIEVNIIEGFEVQASTEGSLWLFFGTDSGFEGLTQLFYTDVNLTFTPDV